MRIALVWAYNSWKTTLAKDLYKRLKEKWYKLDVNKEREIAKLIGFDFRENTKEELDMYQTKLFRDLYLIHSKNSKIITDNPLVNTLWYTKDYKIESAVKEVAEDLYDIFFICAPTKIKDDWVRHIDEEFRKQVFDKIINYIKQIKDKPIVLLSGSKEKRLNEAMEVIKNLEKK